MTTSWKKELIKLYKLPNDNLPVNKYVSFIRKVFCTGIKVKVDLLTPATGTIEEGSPS
jgi:hypothetical protein